MLKYTLLVALLAFTTLGCGSSGPKKKPVFQVRGSVVDSQQQPLFGAIVIFHPVGAAADAPRATGQVDENGAFVLTTYKTGDGAAEGEYAITVTLIPTRSTPTEPEQPDQLGGRYANPQTSTIPHFIVQKGQNQVPVIVAEF